MQIQVSIKKVYGKELVYPICDKALLFTQLAGTSTLTPPIISIIKKLGFTLNIQQQENKPL